MRIRAGEDLRGPPRVHHDMHVAERAVTIGWIERAAGVTIEIEEPTDVTRTGYRELRRGRLRASGDGNEYGHLHHAWQHWFSQVDETWHQWSTTSAAPRGLS